MATRARARANEHDEREVRAQGKLQVKSGRTGKSTPRRKCQSTRHSSTSHLSLNQPSATLTLTRVPVGWHTGLACGAGAIELEDRKPESRIDTITLRRGLTFRCSPRNRWKVLK